MTLFRGSPGPGRVAVACIAAVLFALVPAIAQGPVKVVRILIEGNLRISDDAVLHLMTVKVGDNYNESILRDEFKRIWARGLFADLSIESRDAEGGKAIIVRVTEKPIVSSLEYQKSKIVGETQIEDVLEQRHAQVAIGEPVDFGTLVKAEEAIKSLLHQKGFLDAEVHAETRDLSNGNVAVKFTIEEGAKTRIKHINFTGNVVFSDKKLKKALKNTKEKGMFTRFKQKDVYHPLKMDTDLRAIDKLYQDIGYIDIDLPPPTVTVVEEKTSKKKGKSRKWVDIEQRVIEGRQYVVGEVRVEGNTVFSEGELLSSVPLIPGSILSDSLLRVGMAQIDARYGSLGYFYVSTNRLLNRHEDVPVADVTIKVNEDRQYYLDTINFKGNLTTRDFVLRREIPLAEGDLFDLNKFRLGLRRISQLGYFQLTGEPKITPVPGENKLQVEIEGTEPRRSELQLGGGFSGIDGGFFATSYQTRNFLGRGNIVSVNAQIGSIASRYTVSFTEPQLFGNPQKPVSAGFTVFRRDQDYLDFRTSGSGGSITMGRRLTIWQRMSATLLHETTDFDPDDGRPTTALINSIRPIWSFDTRNNFFRPSRGFQILLSAEYAGGILGGDTSFIKPALDMQYYIPMFGRHYLATNLELGYVRPIGDNMLPTYERYFLGGERSMRNFRSRTVGPMGFICNFGLSEAVEFPSECPQPPKGTRHVRIPVAFESDAIGGNRKFLVNIEYVIPLSQPVDLLFYVDAGNAYAEWDPLTLDLLRGDAGVELRFFLPVFGAPLRLIYGQTFNTTGAEDTRQFLFSIGTTF